MIFRKCDSSLSILILTLRGKDQIGVRVVLGQKLTVTQDRKVFGHIDGLHNVSFAQCSNMIIQCPIFVQIFHQPRMVSLTWKHCKMFMLSRRTEGPLWYQLRSWNSEVAFLFLYQSQTVVTRVKEMYLLNALFKCQQSNHPMNVRHDNSDSSPMLLLLLFSHQVCPTLCDPMDCSTPGLPVPLPKFAQVHVNCISFAIQPSHPLTLSSPSALNLFQHQGLFQ